MEELRVAAALTCATHQKPLSRVQNCALQKQQCLYWGALQEVLPMPQVKGKGDGLNFTSCFSSRLFKNLFCAAGSSPCNPSELQQIKGG